MWPAHRPGTRQRERQRPRQLSASAVSYAITHCRRLRKFLSRKDAVAKLTRKQNMTRAVMSGSAPELAALRPVEVRLCHLNVPFNSVD